MNILITGSNGFIGKNLCVNSALKSFNIFYLRRDNGLINQPENTIIDTGNVDHLIKEFQSKKIGGIVHLASMYVKQHKTSDINLLVESNIAFPTRVIEAATIANVKWFINTGTLWQNLHNEDYNPVNLYAATKEAYQNILRYYSETSSINIVNLKLNDTYGKNDTRHKVLNLLFDAYVNNLTLDMSDGFQKLNLLFIDDVIEGFVSLINQLNSQNGSALKGKSFCLKSNEEYNLREIVGLLEVILGGKININWGAISTSKRNPSVPPNNVQVLPNWCPKTDLKSGLTKTFL